MNRFMASTAIALFAATGAFAQDTGTTETTEGTEMQGQAAPGVFATVSPDPTLQLGSDLIGSAVYSAMTGQMAGTGDMATGDQAADTAATDTATGDAATSDTAGTDMASGDATMMAERPEQIGEISDLIISQDGTVEYAIVGVGGFLGIGERSVAVEMSAISFEPDPQNEGEFMIMVEATQEAIENAPEFDSSVIEGETMGDMGGQTMDSAETTAESAADTTEQAAEDTADAAGDAAEATGDAAQDATSQ